MDYYFSGSQQDLEARIAALVAEALGGKSTFAAAPAQTPPKVLSPAAVLVVVCCADCLSQTVKDQIQELKNQHISVDIEMTDEWEKPVDMEALVASRSAVMLPALSETNIAKVANGIFDKSLTKVLLEALKQGKSPFAICPKVNADLKKNSPTLARLQQAHRQKLAQFGVRITEPKSLAKVLLSALPKSTFAKTVPSSSSGKQLVTAQTVEDAARQNQRTLQFPYRSIVTPLAKDRAKELGVEITWR